MTVNRRDGDKGHGRRTQSERSRSTREALVGTARRLFTELGFAGAGRELIVAEAGLSRGALYHHFSGKDDLFVAVYESVERDLMEAVVRAAVAAADPFDRLRLGCQAFLDAALDPAVQRIVLLDGPAVLEPEVHLDLSERYGLGAMRSALAEAMEAGRVAPAPVEPLARMLLAALMAAAQQVARAADQAVARREAGEALDHLLGRLEERRRR